MTSQRAQNSESLRRFLWIFYGTLFAATILHWIVLSMIVSPVENPLPDLFGYLLGGIAGATALGVLIIRFTRIAALLRPGPMSTPLAVAESLLRAGNIRFWYILCYVLIEAVGLYGFGIGLVLGDANHALPFFLGAAALFILCYPQVPRDDTSGQIG